MKKEKRKYRPHRPEQRRRVSLDYLGETMTVEYDLIRTYGAFSTVRANLYSKDLETQKVALIHALTGSVTSWNATDSEGKTLPVAVESFDRYPGSFINALFNRIAADMHEQAQRF